MADQTPNESRRARSLYTARELPVDTPDFENEDTENEPSLDAYAPNEPSLDAYTPNEPPVDYSAYARHEEDDDLPIEPAFAPPPKLDLTLEDDWADEPVEDVPAAAQNVYRPREVTWADTARREVFTEANGLSYQVQAEEAVEEPPRKRRKRHPVRNTLIILLVLALLAGAAYYFREPIMTLVGEWTGVNEESEAPFEAVTTPEPVKGYDAAPAVALSDRARTAIAEVSGTLAMDTYAITDRLVVARSARSDGLWDYYLFTADEGRLLCYFDGLGDSDVYPLPEGALYVRMSPYLVSPSGSALIRTEDVVLTLGQPIALRQLLNGWAMAVSEDGRLYNFINTAGQLHSRLWASRTFPFTGQYTVAYVDTGATADADTRYLLYVLGTDGSSTRWMAAADMNAVIASAGGMAYMDTGDLYALPNIETPLCNTDDVRLYLDCDAMVVRDKESGKYGLYVHGEQHYDFAYDAIEPVPCDIEWAERAHGGMKLYAVTNASYPQPLSHTFLLTRDGQTEYVALSTLSAYPIALDDEL